MAGRNDVPSSVSFPIPGFAEAQAEYDEAWTAYEERERRIAADRAAWFRHSLQDQGARTRARLMTDLNPLRVAADVYAGEMVAGLAGRAAKAVFSGRMRPGHVQIPTQKWFVREPGSFGGAYDPAPYTGGRSATLARFDESARIIKDVYKNPEARRIIRLAHETGDRSNPVVKLLDGAKEDLARARTALSKELERDYRTALRNLSREFARGRKDVSAGRELAKSIKSGVAADSPKPTLWSRVKGTPGAVWRNKGKVGLGAGATLAGTAVYRRASRDKVQDDGTERINAGLSKYDRAYLEFTGSDALKSAMSDKNALRAGLLRMRDLALAEVSDFNDRAVPVRSRLQGYVDAVKDSSAFAELVSEAETAYAARATNVDDYQNEFREQYRDPASRALGEPYWPEEIGGAP